MPAIPALLLIALVLWLLVSHPKRFLVLWLAMMGIAILFAGSILFVALYLH
ncbi:hypothetical protein QB714_002135 [Salmonella enterica]|nr:hypothetical protein [Salmonella enterica]EKS4718519.1 hypothetical protein [Salmonella enterica]EKS4722054.1 hypothetical protein [Salmonella enterica]EKS4736269.1 hypothetical protein [Salmonella enterica]EKS4773364.1 hypothetical protein [Salmonella enterica]